MVEQTVPTVPVYVNAIRRGATVDGRRGFQPTFPINTNAWRRGATFELCKKYFWTDAPLMRNFQGTMQYGPTPFRHEYTIILYIRAIIIGLGSFSFGQRVRQPSAERAGRNAPLSDGD